MRGWPSAASQQQLQRQLGVVAIADAHRNAQAHLRMPVAPVDDLVGDHRLVRHQRRHAVAVADDDVAAAQFLDPAEAVSAGAGGAGEADHVTGLDRLVHQQHETADEVGGDRLQAEAEAEADGAGEHGQRGEVDARGTQAEQDAEADEEGVGGLDDADAGRRRQRLDGTHAPVDPARDPDARDDEEGHEEQRFTTDQSVMPSLARDSPMESRAVLIASSQPSICAETSAQTPSVDAQSPRP